MKSSPYGPYGLGYTRATMVKTARGNKVIWSKSFKLLSLHLKFYNLTLNSSNSVFKALLKS